jgi:hypothetical protein
MRMEEITEEVDDSSFIRETILVDPTATSHRNHKDSMIGFTRDYHLILTMLVKRCSVQGLSLLNV